MNEKNENKKSTKLKGFTLIELIVVMAIFGIILVAAMQLFFPVSKIMVQSEGYENNQAVAVNIADYLKSSLRPAECMEAYNGTYDPDAIAYDFAVKYYEGILRNGSTPDVPLYAFTDAGGPSAIHVLEIDNSGTDTIVRNYAYDATSLETGHVTVVRNSSNTIDSAINLAYYDSYHIQIRVGDFNEATWNDLVDYAGFAAGAQAGNVGFTIKCENSTAINGSVYTSYYSAFTSLDNINGHGADELNYYVIKEDAGPDPADPHTYSIEQIGAPGITSGTGYPMARSTGTLTARSGLNFTAPTSALENYYFVYSYGSEVVTG